MDDVINYQNRLIHDLALVERRLGQGCVTQFERHQLHQQRLLLRRELRRLEGRRDDD
jgi:outer membrane protein TolC